MPDKELIITVAGRPNSGKTTVAQIIRHALKDQGFADVTVIDPGDETPNKQPIIQRVEATKHRKVTIKTEGLTVVPHQEG